MHTDYDLTLTVLNQFMENLTKTEFDHVCTLHGRTIQLTILLQIKG